MSREVRIIAFAAVACITLDSRSSLADDVVVYKESCSWDMFENWNLSCKVNKNTFINNEPGVPLSYAFRDLKSITVCVSFGNRGGLIVPAVIVHNYSDGSQSKPTELFDTVKFLGDAATGKMSWTGTGPRRAPASAANWSLRADLLRTGDRGPFGYAETLSNGQRTIGEIRATCSFLGDSEAPAK